MCVVSDFEDDLDEVVSADELILGNTHQLAGLLFVIHLVVDLLPRLHRVLLGNVHSIVCPPFAFAILLLLIPMPF